MRQFHLLSLVFLWTTGSSPTVAFQPSTVFRSFVSPTRGGGGMREEATKFLVERRWSRETPSAAPSCFNTDESLSWQKNGSPPL